MERQKVVKAISVTPKSFEKYGTLIPLDTDQWPECHESPNGPWAKVMEFKPGSGYQVLLLRLIRRPRVLTQLERHVRTAEWWINVEGEFVAAFAEAQNPDDPDEQPDPDKVVVFKMSNVAGYLVKRGVWHWPGFPIGESAVQFVDVRTGTVEEDVEYRELTKTIQIEV
jgi:ureidoglycolate hydrolase